MRVTRAVPVIGAAVVSLALATGCSSSKATGATGAPSTNATTEVASTAAQAPTTATAAPTTTTTHLPATAMALASALGCTNATPIAKGIIMLERVQCTFPGDPVRIERYANTADIDRAAQAACTYGVNPGYRVAVVGDFVISENTNETATQAARALGGIVRGLC